MGFFYSLLFVLLRRHFLAFSVCDRPQLRKLRCVERGAVAFPGLVGALLVGRFVSCRIHGAAMAAQRATSFGGGSWMYEWGHGGTTGGGARASPRLMTSTAAAAAAAASVALRSPNSPGERRPDVRRPMWSLDDFDVGRKLGEGRFGKIYLAREKRTKCAVVLKCLSKDMLRYHGLAHQLRREVELQEYAGRGHRHILRLFAYFWDELRVFLVLEYADGGNLLTLLDSRVRHRLSEEAARGILRPLLSALAFLHERDIIHRDVKPDNVLIKGDEVKLADFSWAVRLDRGATHHTRRYTLCGTIDYLAPEQVSRQGCTTKADVWALGILTYRVLCGCLPFEHLSAWEVCARITKGDVRYPSHLSMEACDFMKSLLCVDEAKRLSCEEALQHPFIQGNSCGLDDESVETELPSAVGSSCLGTPETWGDAQLTQLPQLPQPSLTTVAADSAASARGRERQTQPPLQVSDKSNGDGSSQNSTNNGNGATRKWATTATCSQSLSGVSFVTVSSSHSTERIPSVQDVCTPDISPVPHSEWMMSGRNVGNGTASKGGSEDVATSSQGASFSRPRNQNSTCDRSGLATTQRGPTPSLSPQLIYPNAVTDEVWRGAENGERNCVMQLRFDDSPVSLSQLTAASASTVDSAGNT
ncbi:putative protein kinase [Trypanosoma conorhini]|uniref:Aurora kinase n=1 Tax=Trypanosoma conorhini TaxID=83891 RepID=A0A3R7NUA0_9TRYP|nr:putative protein kinase [Trypanosoma conorhini]RNF27164.1 putative protein kinase [Trypanosoma conorhini]